MRKLLRRFDAYTLTALNPIHARLRGRAAGQAGTVQPATPQGGLAERRRRKRIAAELAAYRTPAERLELDLILARHTAEEIREIEELLPHRAG